MDMGSTFTNLLHQMAFFNLEFGNYIMIAVALFFLYLAIKKGFEPLLLVPIAFGMLLTNLPGAGMYHADFFLGGHVDFTYVSASDVTDYVATGELTILENDLGSAAVTLPTYYQMLFPKGTDPAIIDKFAALCKEAIFEDEAYASTIMTPTVRNPTTKSLRRLPRSWRRFGSSWPDTPGSKLVTGERGASSEPRLFPSSYKEGGAPCHPRKRKAL